MNESLFPPIGIAEEELDPFHEAVYEEIEYKLARQGTYDAPRRGE